MWRVSQSSNPPPPAEPPDFQGIRGSRGDPHRDPPAKAHLPRGNPHGQLALHQTGKVECRLVKPGGIGTPRNALVTVDTSIRDLVLLGGGEQTRIHRRQTVEDVEHGREHRTQTDTCATRTAHVEHAHHLTTHIRLVEIDGVSRVVCGRHSAPFLGDKPPERCGT